MIREPRAAACGDRAESEQSHGNEENEWDETHYE